jgi:cyanophycin synthetase
MRTQVDVVLREGAAVLNADDERLVDMAELSDGQVIFYSTDALNPAIVDHLEHGRRAVFARGQDVVMAIGRDEAVIDSLLSGGDSAAILPAVAVGWAMGMAPEVIRKGVAAPQPGHSLRRVESSPALVESTL